MELDYYMGIGGNILRMIMKEDEYASFYSRLNPLSTPSLKVLKNEIHDWNFDAHKL